MRDFKMTLSVIFTLEIILEKIPTAFIEKLLKNKKV
jgi:hypothetical protein